MSYWGSPVTLAVTPTSPTDNQLSTITTIHAMITLARDSARYPQINSIVSSLVKSLPRHSSMRSLVEKVFWWVRNHITFREDEDILIKELGYQDPYQELLISPIALLSMPHPEGDCDDFSMLLASLLIAARVPVWYVAIAVDESQPDRWSHIYNKVFLQDEGVYLPLDASYGTYPGWETSRKVFKKMEWSLNA